MLKEKNFYKKMLAVLLVAAISVGTLSVPAKAADANSDPTGFGLKDMSYAQAKIMIPPMNAVFDVCNTLAGAVEVWSCLDGKLYKDLSYGERNAQKYDLYIPKKLDKNATQKVIIFVHGGTWSMGEKEHMAWAAARFAKQGYITATMDYDLASQGNDNVARATGSKSNATVYDMLDDVTLCISAIKQKAASLGYQVNALALSGVSAGSNITGLYAYTRAEESEIPVKCLVNVTMPAEFRNGGFDNYTPAEVAQFATIVSGVELTGEDITNPDADALAVLESISPAANVTKDSVPTLMGYAGKDKTIGTNQYNCIKAALDANHVDNDVVWWENSDHTLTKDPGTMKKFTDRVAQWLKKYM